LLLGAPCLSKLSRSSSLIWRSKSADRRSQSRTTCTPVQNTCSGSGLRSSYSVLLLQEVRCRVPWPAQVLFLGDPRSYRPECENYQLQSGRIFRYEDVLNHRLRENGRLEPRESLEGLLLAYTMFDRISFDYLHGETAIARLWVVDQHCRKHRAELEISIDRSATIRLFKRRPRGQGLFELQEGSKTRPSLNSLTVADSIKARALRAEVENRAD
jgi:hypothetical protein